MKAQYIAARVPTLLTGTCIELAWAAADIEATAGEPVNAINLAALLTDADVPQIRYVEDFAIAIARTRCNLATDDKRWTAWRKALVAQRIAPWNVLAATANLIATPLDVELGLSGGHWEFIAERDSAE